MDQARALHKETEHGHYPDAEPVAFSHAEPDTHSAEADQAVIEAALYVAMGCGVISALAGSRTAWILLASAAFCIVLDIEGVTFNPPLWMLFDTVVVWFLLRAEMTVADVVIIALFIPAWVFYLMPDEQRYAGSLAVVTVQFLLSVDLGKIASAPRRCREWWRGHRTFDEMVAHVRLAGA